MGKQLLKKRLTNLQKDISFGNSYLDAKCTMYDDIKASLDKLKEDYVRDHIPVKTSRTEIGVQSDCDMNDVFINFSEGYEKFSRKIAKQKKFYQYKRDSAIFLLDCIMKLESPYNELLFIKYFLNASSDTIEKLYFYSRTSLYRNLDRGTDKLSNYIRTNDPEGDYTDEKYQEYMNFMKFYDIDD